MTKLSTLTIPCLRGAMGDWVYYVALMRFKDIGERIRIAEEVHKNTALNALIQRSLTDRSEVIADYLINQKQRFFNAIIAGVYLGSPEWFPVTVRGNEIVSEDELSESVKESIGVLHLSGAERLFALDGQHRVEGIRQALKTKPELGDEEQSVIFVAHRNTKSGLERTRRLFSTLNRYAKPVGKGEIIALDEDDPVAITTRYVLETHPFLKIEGMVLPGKVKQVPTGNKVCFTSIQSIYEALGSILRTDFWKNRTRPSEVDLNKCYSHAMTFFNSLERHFLELGTLKSKTATAGDYRHKGGGHLLFRPVGLEAVAKTVQLGVEAGIDMDTMIKRISKMPMQLSDPPWVGVFWDPIKHRMINRKESKNLAVDLLAYMANIPIKATGVSKEELTNRLSSILGREEVRLPRRVKT